MYFLFQEEILFYSVLRSFHSAQCNHSSLNVKTCPEKENVHFPNLQHSNPNWCVHTWARPGCCILLCAQTSHERTHPGSRKDTWSWVNTTLTVKGRVEIRARLLLLLKSASFLPDGVYCDCKKQRCPHFQSLE